MVKCASEAEAHRVFQEGILGNARREAAQLASRGHVVPDEIRQFLANATPSSIPVPSSSPPGLPLSHAPTVSNPPAGPSIPPAGPSITPTPHAGTSNTSTSAHHTPLPLYHGYNHTGAPPPAELIPGFPPTTSLIPASLEEYEVQIVGPLLEAVQRAADRSGDDTGPIRVRPEDLPVEWRDVYAARLQNVSRGDVLADSAASSSPSITPPSSTAPLSSVIALSDIGTTSTLSDDGTDTGPNAFFLSAHDSDYGEGVDDRDVIGNSVVLPDPESIVGPINVTATVPDVRGAEPYVVQVALPRDYVDRGHDVRVRVNVNVSTPSDLFLPHITHHPFPVRM